MSDPVTDELRGIEARLKQAAGDFPYPPTPGLAKMALVRRAPAPRLRRRLAYAGLVILAVAAALFAVPPVRAVVLEFIRLGAVRIIPPQPTAESTPPAESISPVTATPASGPPIPSPTQPESLLGLVGETTLEEARAEAGFPILLPTYPTDLGEPDSVFLQHIGGVVVVLVWMDADHPGEVALSLHALGPGVDALKGPVDHIEQTQVNGEMALWTEGQYMLMFLVGGQEEADFRRLVNGRVLIWMVGEVTYRLESGLPLEEAVRVAESLR